MNVESFAEIGGIRVKCSQPAAPGRELLPSGKWVGEEIPVLLVCRIKLLRHKARREKVVAFPFQSKFLLPDLELEKQGTPFS